MGCLVTDDKLSLQNSEFRTEVTDDIISAESHCSTLSKRAEGEGR